MILLISTSLNPESNSRILAREARRVLDAEGQPTAWLDLQEVRLPLCDGVASYGDPDVRRVGALVGQASAIILATAIYNYDANAAAKNLIELTGSGWENKPVGFLCAAGGANSYMSILSLANSLMLDFRSLIVPRFVYATGDAFASGEVTSSEIRGRVADLARSTARLGRLLKAA